MWWLKLLPKENKTAKELGLTQMQADVYWVMEQDREYEQRDIAALTEITFDVANIRLRELKAKGFITCRKVYGNNLVWTRLK